MYVSKKEKYGDYKNLPLKCTTNSNNLLIILLYILIYLFSLLC